MTKQRLSRDETTRGTQARKKGWKSPSQLDAPEPPVGWRYRWVRWMVDGREDTSNLMKTFAQGYEPVRREELPLSYMLDVFEDSHKKYAGVVRQHDLMLCKIDEEIIDDRSRQMRELAARQQGIVNNELTKHSTELMPIERPQISTTTQIGQRPEFQED